VQYYGPDFKLAILPSNAENGNSKQYLDKITTQILENLKQVTFAPSVQLSEVPRQSMGMSNERESERDDFDQDEHQDVRSTQYRRDKMVAREDAYVLDSEDEADEPMPYDPRKFHDEIEDDEQRPLASKRVGIMNGYSEAGPAGPARLSIMGYGEVRSATTKRHNGGNDGASHASTKRLKSLGEYQEPTLASGKKSMKEGESVADFLASTATTI